LFSLNVDSRYELSPFAS